MINSEHCIRTTRFPNGLTMIAEVMPDVESVAFGVWADAGSADEQPHEYGQAHFLEHMLFKGTESRSAFQLAETIEDVGGQLNAYTERETTHLYARVLAEHAPVAVEMLADMVCHSVFPQDELDRERQVITEEIRKYESLPDERIHDLFMEGLWHGGGLGHAILGTEDSVQTITRESLTACWRNHFAANRVLITVAGKFQHDALVEQVARAFAELPSATSAMPLTATGECTTPLILEEDCEQINFCWGGRSYAAHDDRNYPLAILDAVIGASTTSRLFQEIREKRGLAYDVSSYSMGFRNTGLFCTDGACSPETFPTVIRLMREQLRAVHQHGITDREIARAKEQIKAEVALSLESSVERMRRLAIHHLTWGTVVPLPDIIAKVSAVTVQDIGQVIDEVMNIDQWVFSAIGTIEAQTVTDMIQG